MVERPILMKGPLVVKTLAGEKTETRRPIKAAWLKKRGWVMSHGNDRARALEVCPYGKAGDRLWVRENVQYPKSFDADSPKGIAKQCVDAGYEGPWAPIRYCADGGTANGDVLDPDIGWGKVRPGIHLPRWACRLVLEVTHIKIQRVQDILEEEAMAEGVVLAGWNSHRLEFAALWGEMYKDHVSPSAWDENPWVWVVKFKRVFS